MNPYIAKLSHRSVIRIDGPDSDQYLQGLISNDIEKCGCDFFTYATLLSPQGKLLYDFFILKNTAGNGYIIDIPSSYSEELIKKLNIYKLRSKVDISTCDDLRVITSNEKVFEDFYPDPRVKDFCFRALVDCSKEYNSAEHDYHNSRINLKVPELSLDFDSNQFYPLELSMDKLNAIDYQKGCYVGQEVTARTTYRGVVRKSIYKLEFDKDHNLQKGDEVCCNELLIGSLMQPLGRSSLAILNSEKAVHAIENNLSVTVKNTGAMLA